LAAAIDESTVHAALCRILRAKKVTENTSSVAVRRSAGWSVRYVIVAYGTAANALVDKLTEITGDSGSIDAAICVWALTEIEAFALLRDAG
jgi:hypothetical protein